MAKVPTTLVGEHVLIVDRDVSSAKLTPRRLPIQTLALRDNSTMRRQPFRKSLDSGCALLMRARIGGCWRSNGDQLRIGIKRKWGGDHKRAKFLGWPTWNQIRQQMMMHHCLFFDQSACLGEQSHEKDKKNTTRIRNRKPPNRDESLIHHLLTT